MELSPTYNPKDVEHRHYRAWESQGLFRAKAGRTPPPYTIVIPPPNVTGILHMGHALNITIQDILIRYKRMQGRNALWIPGTDHAGIATQNVVERALAKEGKRRQDLGREAFVERVWQWKAEYGETIIRQLKRLGASCDWERTRFTMDPGMSEAVTEVFVRLYRKGLIYRGRYIINWCPRCQTALSDEEAPRKPTQGKLYTIRYPLKGVARAKGSRARGGSARAGAIPTHIEVATTRPETMLGDTAVAVHPKDARYKALVGARAVLPLVGRELPIIADRLVDPKFGTGAVKVTPAHDPVDFQLARRHDLKTLNIMTGDGRMCDVPEPYRGLDRFAAREQVLRALQEQGLLVKTVDHPHGVGHCYRCDTVVEPRLSPQWFVRMKPLAKPALEAVKRGRVRFSPKRWTKVYVNWMEHIEDWCISRQIWWGHRLPVWYCRACLGVRGSDILRPELAADSASAKKGIIVQNTPPTKCPHCGSITGLEQDQDVLDTWFSSWLWPFSTLGWPKRTPDLSTFYPTQTLVTAPEIIFFWVARMIMAGKFCVGKIPFQDVYIHGTVRDLTGKKMSKSLGNIIDPLDIIEQYGTDALRYTLVTATAIGQDVFVSQERFVAGRNFANKLWNATRYVLSQEGAHPSRRSAEPVTSADRWILSRLHATITKTSKALDHFALNEAAHTVYDFIWRDFCDWYLEMSKVYLGQGATAGGEAVARSSRAVLVEVLETSLRLLHPVMPFLTEELWQHVTGGDRTGRSATRSIMKAPWPTPRARWKDLQAERRMEILKAVVTAVRITRVEFNVPNGVRPPVHLAAKAPAMRRFLEEHRPIIQALAHVSEITVEATVTRPPESAASVVDGLDVIVPLAGFIDTARERQRLKTRLQELTNELARLDAQLRNKQFIARAPEAVVLHTKARRRQVTDTRKRITAHLGGFR